MLYNFYCPEKKGGEDVPPEIMLPLITALLRDCKDIDLLDLIYRLLIQNAEQLHDSLELDRVQVGQG